MKCYETPKCSFASASKGSPGYTEFLLRLWKGSCSFLKEEPLPLSAVVSVPQVRTLFVSGLPVDIKPRELYLLFRPFKVSLDPATWGQSLGRRRSIRNDSNLDRAAESQRTVYQKL